MKGSKLHFLAVIFQPIARCFSIGLDVAVKAAATRYAMGTTLLLLLAWCIWGMVRGASDTWQVVLQDVSSIQAYLSDTLLLRQQANMTRNLCERIFGLMSRSEATERVVLSMTPEKREAIRRAKRHERDDVAAAAAFEREDKLDKISNVVALGAGSLIFMLMYIAGIIVWIFMGIPHHFSDLWQLIINTTTAFEITFMSMFLQNIRGQHEDHLERVVRGIDTIDDAMDEHLKRLTGVASAPVVVPSLTPETSRWHRMIDKYGRLIGGGAGVMLAIIVFIVWLSIGDVMHFDDNWFLIIGTYTGLAGFIDGFVLKNVDRRQTTLADRHFAVLLEQDRKVFDIIGIEMPQPPEHKKQSLTLRISCKIGNWCSATRTTYLSVLVVLALIGVASGMKWTETGQLLCNSPTMIVEGFVLVTLLQAHNLADSERRLKYDYVLKRRLVLEGHLAAMEELAEKEGGIWEKSLQKPQAVVVADSVADNVV